MVRLKGTYSSRAVSKTTGAAGLKHKSSKFNATPAAIINQSTSSSSNTSPVEDVDDDDDDDNDEDDEEEEDIDEATKLSEVEGNEEDDDQHAVQTSRRPQRRARAHAHIFRYLQTRDPTRLEEADLRKALSASLEDAVVDSASCCSSDQSNAPSSATSSNSPSATDKRIRDRRHHSDHHQSTAFFNTKRRPSSTQNMQNNNRSQRRRSLDKNSPYAVYHQNSVHHNRYKPVVHKNIQDEADFFHEGIMEYIEFQLIERQMKRDA